MISTNELPLALLQLACNLGVGLALTRMAFYTCVQLMEPLNNLRRKSSSCFLWLLGSGAVISSILWSFQMLAQAGLTIPLTSFMTAVVMVLLTAINVRGKRVIRSNLQTKHRQNQSQMAEELPYPHTFKGESIEEVTEEIIAPADEVSQVERRQGNLAQVSSSLGQAEHRHSLRGKRSTHLISSQTPESFYLYASPHCLTLLGYKSDELIEQSVPNHMFPHIQYWARFTHSHFSRLNPLEMEALGYPVHCQGDDYICFKRTARCIQHPDLGVVEEIVPVSCDLTNSQHAIASGKLNRLQVSAHPEAPVEGDSLQYGMRIDVTTRNQPQTADWEPASCKVTSQLPNHRESLLFELTNQIRNSLELDTVLETAVQLIHNLLPIDRCYFSWYRSHKNDPYWEVVKEAKNPHLKSHLDCYSMTQMGLLGKRLVKQQVVQVNSVETASDSTLRQLLQGIGYTSLLSIPLKTKQGEIGAITCVCHTKQQGWECSEVELLQAVVGQLAIAIEQAELYEQTRQAAERAQVEAQELEHSLKQLKTTQAQLVQSAKMSSLGQLVAGIAHEINNPVNFIHGNLTYASAYIYDLLGFLHLYQQEYPHPTAEILERAELIEYDFLSNDLPKLLHSMQQGTDRIHSIVHNLRNFSRLDEAEKKEVNLHEGIDSTLLILQHRLKPQGCHPEIQVFKEYGQLPSVMCYPGELNQVFLNILSNAIEAFDQPIKTIQEKPSPAITIRTRLLNHSDPAQHALSHLTESSSPKPNQSIVIQIVDNGSGMTEAVKARIFDPFFTTKSVGQGIGLGLSICYQIVVDRHHGVLTCTSTAGEGTEFWIEIPIKAQWGMGTRV